MPHLGNCVSADAPLCDTATQSCVRCLTNTDCPSAASVCELAATEREANRCAFAQCNPPTPVCNEQTQTCVGCLADRDCVDEAGVGRSCRTDDARCVECLSDAQCSDDPTASNCSRDGACVACAGDGIVPSFKDGRRVFPASVAWSVSTRATALAAREDQFASRRMPDRPQERHRSTRALSAPATRTAWMPTLPAARTINASLARRAATARTSTVSPGKP
jgi:hypothetical protein